MKDHFTFVMERKLASCRGTLFVAPSFDGASFTCYMIFLVPYLVSLTFLFANFSF